MNLNQTRQQPITNIKKVNLTKFRYPYIFTVLAVGKRCLSGPLRLSLLSTTKSQGNIKPTLIIQGRQKEKITKLLIQVRDNSKNCCCYFAQNKKNNFF